jgi:hypothetical protein
MSKMVCTSPTTSLPVELETLVISHLSVGPYAVEEAMFQSVMKYIFTFIEKVRAGTTLKQF